MKNRRRQAARNAFRELEQHSLQLGLGIALSLFLIAWIIGATEDPPLTIAIVIAAIASGLIGPPLDRAIQEFWRSSSRTTADTTDALWAPDWPEATAERRTMRRWQRRWVKALVGGLIWASFLALITFLATVPVEQLHRQNAPLEEFLPSAILAAFVALIGGFLSA